MNFKAKEAERKPTPEEVAWAAGVYEGEGNIAFGHGQTSLQITISQKDTWILYKLQTLFGGSVYEAKSEWKNPCSYYKLCGSNARGFALQIYRWLSPRRKKEIDNLETFRDIETVLGKDNLKLLLDGALLK